MDKNVYGISDNEYKILLKQIERRKKFRKEYLKQRTNPYLHAQQAGHVVKNPTSRFVYFLQHPYKYGGIMKFDEAHMRYIAMQATELERFRPNKRNIIFGICAMIIPMFSYGLLVTSDRNELERKYKSGQIRYRDRLFKLR